MSTISLSGLLPVFLVVVVLLGLVIAGMAVGVMFKRPCLRGSCGGPELVTAKGDKISCLTCPNRRRQRQATTAAQSTTDSATTQSIAMPRAQRLVDGRRGNGKEVSPP